MASIGDLMLDVIFYVSNLPQRGMEQRAQSSLVCPGGASANFAVAAVRLGSPSAVAGKVGSDPAGEALLSLLEQEGVDASEVVVVDGPSGLVVSIVDSSGERTMVSHMPRECLLLPGDLDERVFNDAFALHSTGYSLLPEPQRSLILQVVRSARASGVLTMFDPSPVVEEIPRDVVAEAVELSSLVLPNEAEYEALLNMGLRDVLEGKTVVKMGERGCMAPDGSVVQGFRAELVDPTGAGDAFAAALAVGLQRGLSLQEACRFANAAASLKVERRGSSIGMPTLGEVLKRLGERA